MFPFFVLCSSYEDPDKCLLLYGDDQVGVEGLRGQSSLIQGPDDHVLSFQGGAKGGGSRWEDLFLEGEAQAEEREEETQRYGKCMKF